MPKNKKPEEPVNRTLEHPFYGGIPVWGSAPPAAGEGQGSREVIPNLIRTAADAIGNPASRDLAMEATREITSGMNGKTAWDVGNEALEKWIFEIVNRVAIAPLEAEIERKKSLLEFRHKEWEVAAAERDALAAKLAKAEGEISAKTNSIDNLLSTGLGAAVKLEKITAERDAAKAEAERLTSELVKEEEHEKLQRGWYIQRFSRHLHSDGTSHAQRTAQIVEATWQHAIDEIISKHCPNRDGSGSDGDALDLTLAELNQMIEHISSPSGAASPNDPREGAADEIRKIICKLDASLNYHAGAWRVDHVRAKELIAAALRAAERRTAQRCCELLKENGWPMFADWLSDKISSSSPAAQEATNG